MLLLKHALTIIFVISSSKRTFCKLCDLQKFTALRPPKIHKQSVSRTRMNTWPGPLSWEAKNCSLVKWVIPRGQQACHWRNVGQRKSERQVVGRINPHLNF